MTVEELVLKFDNVIPVKAIHVPKTNADGEPETTTIFIEDYARRQKIFEKHGVTKGESLIR